jgi:outer membrane protein
MVTQPHNRLSPIRAAVLPRLALLGALLVSPGRAASEPAASSPDNGLTLEQAVSMALQNNRQVQVAALEVRRGEHAEAEQHTGRLPSFSTSVLAGELLSPVNFRFNRGALGTTGSGPVPSRDTDVRVPQKFTYSLQGQIAQPLTQLHRINLGIRMQAAATGAAREGLRAQQQSVVAQVKQAYYSLLQTQSALAAEEEALTSDRELERVVSNDVAQQTALQSDLLQVRAQVAQQEYDMLTLRDSLATTREQLNFLLGQDVRTEFQVRPIADTLPAEQTLTGLQTLALQQRPDVRQARLKVTQATLDRRITRTQYTPDVSLALTYAKPYNVQVMPDKFLNIGFLLTWTPWDWGKRREEVAQKTQVIEEAKRVLQDTEAQALIDVAAQFRKLREARDLLQVTEARQAAEREKSRITMNRFTQKAALLKDVLQEQATLADANHQYRQALLQAATAQAALEKALGEN